MVMYCFRCRTPMVLGVAIKPRHESNVFTIVPSPPLKADELKLVDVWKCPSCGESAKQ